MTGVGIRDGNTQVYQWSYTIVVENELNKLKKGPNGRYTNVWLVMSDLDILIGAYENVVS
ncbi:hypothetical protein JHK85_012027 [Glycine max]|nr:hypothetical protein JHK85_012027 [Glycine max]